MSAQTRKEDGGDLIEAMQQFAPYAPSARELNPREIGRRNRRRQRRPHREDPVPHLSAASRKALLRNAGFRPTILCRVCSKCGRMAAMAEGPHPLDEKIAKLKKYLAGQTNRHSRQFRQADGDRHYLESVRHHTSRCCGERYEKREVDHHQALWEAWTYRRERCRLPIEQLRIEHAERTTRERSDDFLMLSRNLGLGDNTIEVLEQIFRTEERNQAIEKGLANGAVES